MSKQLDVQAHLKAAACPHPQILYCACNRALHACPQGLHIDHMVMHAGHSGPQFSQVQADDACVIIYHLKHRQHCIWQQQELMILFTHAYLCVVGTDWL